MSQNDLKKRKKVICPECGGVNSQVWLGEHAKSQDIWIKCKFCKKEIEIRD